MEPNRLFNREWWCKGFAVVPTLGSFVGLVGMRSDNSECGLKLVLELLCIVSEWLRIVCMREWIHVVQWHGSFTTEHEKERCETRGRMCACVVSQHGGTEMLVPVSLAVVGVGFQDILDRAVGAFH